jgi:hypothetical protein
MTKKTYPVEITNEISIIANQLNKVFKQNKGNLRNIAKFSGMSVNSVKAVLAGKTANIASYCLIAKALGTNLINVIDNIPVENNSTAGLTTTS